MVSPISRIANHGQKAQEVKAADPKNDVNKTDAQKSPTATPPAAAPPRENQEPRAEEVREKPAAESDEALRILASREQNTPPPAPGKNTTSADAVIAAYKK
ncbi:hypothetical protein EG834_03245 [bacterium]|nr:hypothetical protein [bacterium]